jgi:hypothetical protein
MTICFRNNRTSETISVAMTRSELINSFLSVADDSHWMWFHIAKAVEEARTMPERRDMIAFLADSFLFAVGMGLKKPMIRLQHENRRFKIYLSQKGTLCFKSGRVIPGTSDPEGDEEYMGCLYAGKFLAPKPYGSNVARKLYPAEESFLAELSADPVGFMARTSKDMDRCCYCNLPLEDARSKQVGYGAICAVRWGLPWGKSYDEKVPSFADLWGRSTNDTKRDIRGICAEIRKNPFDEFNWTVLADVLEEVGYTKRPTVPARGIVIPSGS